MDCFARALFRLSMIRVILVQLSVWEASALHRIHFQQEMRPPRDGTYRINDLICRNFIWGSPLMGLCGSILSGAQFRVLSELACGRSVDGRPFISCQPSLGR